MSASIAAPNSLHFVCLLENTCKFVSKDQQSADRRRKPQHRRNAHFIVFLVTSPAGLEPATCGLEIRCCYPAELRGRDRKPLPQDRLHLPAPQRAAPTGSPADRRHGANAGDARTFFLPLFPLGAELA